MQSSLPVWAIIMILGIGVVFIMGFVSPYVPKKSREEVEAYLRNSMIFRRPVVEVKDYIPAKVCIVIVAIISTSSFVLFFVESFRKLYEFFNCTLFAGVAIAVVAFLAFGFYMMTLLTIYLIGGTLTTMSYERIYRDRYGLDIRYESDLEKDQF